MTGPYDLFFSYRRHDLPRAQPLLSALAEAGLRVWRDEEDIPDHESITAEIRRAIANSKILLAFYSLTYPLSKPCQEEIITAWLAAPDRVLIINPEESFEHIPELLRDRQSPHSESASAIKNRIDALPRDTLLSGGALHLPDYFGMKPVQARSFVGRIKELWDLHGKLTANRISIISGARGQDSAQVRGLGGNGKSLLAREYSIRFGAAYPGGVFWINAFGHDDSKASLLPEQRGALRQDQIHDFAIHLQISTEGLKPEEIEARFWQFLKQRDQPCLWIVDDVPSALSPDELEREWYAGWPGASTLITTRSREYGSRGDVLDLDVLSSEEAFDLLCSHRKPAVGAEEEAARQIIQLLGYHPLAVDVAGSYLAQGVQGFEAYLSELRSPAEDAVEFGALLKESLPTGHERSISATFLKSIGQLSEEGLDFLRLAAILAVAPIPLGFVAEVLALLDPTRSGRVIAMQAVDQAAVLSLCEKRGDDARAVHTLVSRTMRFQFPGDQRTAQLRCAAVGLFTRRFKVAGDIREHGKLAPDLPHARHLLTSGLEDEQETTLAHWVARYDLERGAYHSAHKLHEQVLEASHRVLGPEHLDTLTAMNNLASTLFAQADYAAAQALQEQVLSARRRVRGEEHPASLTAMNNLAGTLYAKGDLKAARSIQEQVLSISRRALGPWHPDTLSAMGNLAFTLSTQGDLATARTIQEQVVQASQRVLGDEHPDTLKATNNLGSTISAQGDLPTARRLREQVLAVRRRVLGEEHPDTLSAMDNFASTLSMQGDPATARKLHERAVEAFRRVLGEEHPETLTAMNNLAYTLGVLREWRTARKLHEIVFRARLRVVGHEHRDTLTTMNNLALTMYAQGDRIAARRLLEQVLETSRRVLGEQDSSTLRTRAMLDALRREDMDPPSTT